MSSTAPWTPRRACRIDPSARRRVARFHKINKSDIQPRRYPARYPPTAPRREGSAVDRDDQGDDQDRDDVRDLDHRVDRRAGRVLVRVADRVAGDGRGMRLAALAPEGAVLDQLLRVV